VCGVDEAGRGPLAGPVFAAAVILGRGVVITGMGDSKVLTGPQRQRCDVEIRLRATAWAVASASVDEIDSINILRASLLAMQRAVDQLTVRPTCVLVDGNHCPVLPCPARANVKGDATVAEISAASILAKVARDAYMAELHVRYPAYGFDQHKGYCTAAHFAALRLHGASPVHRRSFEPVRLVIEALDPVQRPLFDRDPNSVYK
jgi:ribonuclease HII